MKRYKFLFIVSDLRAPQICTTMGSALAEAEKRGVTICTISDSTGQTREHASFLTRYLYKFGEKQFDGAIVFTAHLNLNLPMEILRTVLPQNLPGIPLLGLFSAPEGIPCITADNRAGIHAMVEHLVCHHRLTELAFFIHRPKGERMQEWENRYGFFLESARGLNIQKGNLTLLERNGPEDQIKGLDRFLKKIGDKPCGIVCQDDRHAVLLCACLKARKIEIGGRVKVTGFSDFKQNSQMIEVPLTSSRMPIQEIGTMAVNLLIAANEKKIPVADTVLPFQPVWRESCGCFSESGEYLKFGESSHGVAQGSNWLSSGDDVHKTSVFTILSNKIVEAIDERESASSFKLLEEGIESSSRKNDKSFLIQAAFTAGKLDQRLLLSRLRKHERTTEIFELRIGRMLQAANDRDLAETMCLVLEYLKVKRCQVVLLDNDIPITPAPPADSELPGMIMYDYRQGDEYLIRQDTAVTSWKEAFVSFAGSEGSVVCFPLVSNNLLLGFVMYTGQDNLLNFYNRLTAYFAISYFRVRLLRQQGESITELHIAGRKLKEYGEKMESLSRTDELTGLCNRRGFLERANELVQYCDRHRKDYSVFFVDLDYLKKINDHFGHAEGDFALNKVASVLVDTFRESDVLSRYGGDEFIVFAIHAERPLSKEVRTRFKANLDKVNGSWDRGYILSATMGITTNRANSNITLSQILADADKVMYSHKKKRPPFSLAKKG